MHSLCPSYPVQTNPNFPDNSNFTFSLTLAWLFKVGIERTEEAVNNSVGEAAGEFFQNIGEVPASACSLFLFYTVVVYNVQISAW